MQCLRAVLGHQAQLDVRIALLETRQPWRQPLGEKRRNRTQAQGAADFPGIQAQQLGLDAAVGFGHRLRQALALGAQLHAARSAQEHLIAQPLLQLAHLLADRAGRDVQFFSAAGKRKVSRRTGEHVQPDEQLAIELSSHCLAPLKTGLESFVGHLPMSTAVSLNTASAFNFPRQSCSGSSARHDQALAWLSVFSTCSKSASARPVPTPSAPCGPRRRLPRPCVSRACWRR
ncbi:hypothetical protein D3C71_1530160 [compost metagenome]